MNRKENGLSTFPLVPILLLTGIFFFNFTPRIVFAPFLSTIERELGLNHEQVGSFFLWISSGYCLTLLLSGFVSAKLPHRRTILLSTLAVGGTLLWIAKSQTFGTLRLGLLAMGMAAGLHLPSGLATITALVRPEHLGRALAIHEMASGLGFVVTPLGAEAVLRVGSWRLALVLLGGGAMVMAAAFANFGKGGDFRGLAPTLKNLRPILGRPSFWVLLVLFILAMGASMGVYTMMPLFLVSERGLDRATANTLVALSRILGLFSVLSAGYVIDRLELRKALTLFLLSIGALTFLLGVTSGPLLIPVVFLQPMLAVCFLPTGWAAIARMGPLGAQNVVVSLTIPVAVLLGCGSIPAGIGFLGEHHSFSLAFMLLGGLILMSTLLTRYLGS